MIRGRNSACGLDRSEARRAFSFSRLRLSTARNLTERIAADDSAVALDSF
jgi:hypothetical protein